MWIFENPEYLLLLTLMFPSIFFSHFYRGRGGLVPASTGLWKSSSFKPKNYFIRLILFLSTVSFWLGVAFIIVALAGPSYVEKEKIYLSRGIDIMFVLDESPSMAALDFPPTNRFDASKNVIRKFVKAREHDPVGLVTFAAEAALRIPPTLDTDGFLDELEDLELMELGNGTAVGLGIAIAALHLQDSTAEEKVIILITDGENNAGEIVPESAAEIAAGMGIRIYTIGIGTRGEVAIEYEDPETGKIITGRYDSDFDEDLLTEIAETTNGKYYFASSTNALDGIIDIIDSLESSEKRIKIKTTSRSGHRPLIIMALCLIFFDFFIRKLIFREVL
ncbi:MAG: VWA domain-containing protein [Spirochaetales bacterium]|uniref:VWA domain-containing protein n=1 Tax=Candidatus Thalassospirochaeta sargassi TaxID=3119039 RepID=A0AAJ1IF88_9SPIO|nr:VWA domain-containing protein [Spirochaetales bacterium]